MTQAGGLRHTNALTLITLNYPEYVQTPPPSSTTPSLSPMTSFPLLPSELLPLMTGHLTLPSQAGFHDAGLCNLHLACRALPQDTVLIRIGSVLHIGTRCTA
jgi:hypothetical protein